MRRLPMCLVAGLIVAFASAVVSADVRTDQRVRFQVGGAIGKLVNVFGGKSAREGVVSTVAVKGERKVTFSDTTGQIIDLSEEKIYDLDLQRKTYKVTTFAQLREEMEKARREAEQRAQEMERERAEAAPAQKDPSAKEVEIDFTIENTDATRVINGFDTRQSVMTITVREKDKTLDESGGLVVTTDLWLASSAPSTSDIIEFDLKYAEKLFGQAAIGGASARDMAMLQTMYPQIKPALERAAREGSKLEGTAILTEMKVEAVPPGAANTSADALPKPEPEPEQKRSRLGGLMGGLKRMAEAAKQNESGAEKPPQRAIVMTTTVEMLKLTREVSADVVAIPAGFKPAN